MRVKLVKPPAVQNNVRGIGVYGRYLEENLKNVSGIEIVESNQDITHYLYFDPFFLTLPPFRRTKTVVTVFDLTEIILANLYPRGFRGEFKWQIQKRLLKNADAVITISKSAKNDIIKIVGYPEEKIFVTYLAAGKEYKKLDLKRENFVLYIGDINPNKNISSLLKALTILKNEKLVMVGKALASSSEIKKEISSLGLENRVTLPGYVSEEEKVILLNKAKVYVQPSIYEGFGLPVIEAMACGTPVICGDNSSFPEVAGDAATYANVSDSKDLAEKIKKIQLTGREISQAKKFSWEKAAQETYEVYAKILSGE